LNFGLAKKYGGRCHLRFDDTNPKTESDEYVNSIKEDVKWLGFDWGEHCYFASDYFDQLYEWALHLIREGRAYVCELSAEEFKAIKGNLVQPGSNSKYRERTVEENLALFEKMRAGEIAEQKAVLRAKIDMAHPNVHMRDPPLYRIVHASHHNTGDKWKIYPMYDYAHGQEDAIEHITHSICTLEFKSHRDLYFWFLENLPVPAQPIQYEFARLNVTNTVMSKRKLLRLVKEGIVDGWDDPRMPTICGMRRRGLRPEALRNFCDKIGVTTSESLIDSALLD
jgi:glutaminyl-tRNA synthetase